MNREVVEFRKEILLAALKGGRTMSEASSYSLLSRDALHKILEISK